MGQRAFRRSLWSGALRAAGALSAAGALLACVALPACGDASETAARTDSAAPSASVSCADARPVETHFAAGETAPAQASQASSCFQTTGLPAVDVMLVRTARGTLLMSPAGGAALLRSTDGGKTWGTPIALPDAPAGSIEVDAAGMNFGLLHPWLWRDARTERLFFNIFDARSGVPACGSDASGSYLWTSDDDGQTWQRGYAGCGSKDWGKIITGPAATGPRRQALAESGYPNMVYFCATGPTLIIGPAHLCYRSTDGGKSFTPITDPLGTPVLLQTGWPNAGAVAPDGTLYVAKLSATGLAIAISDDEGDSWRDVHIPGSAHSGADRGTWLSNNVVVDAAGNVYAVWVDERDHLPYIATSRDRGASWSAPRMFAPPDVRVASYPSIAVDTPGRVAVAYYASTQAESTGGDGYFNSDGRPYSALLTATTDLFADKPLFRSARFNAPEQPVVQGMSFVASEYLGAPQFDGDGSIWAAYVNGTQGALGKMSP